MENGNLTTGTGDYGELKKILEGTWSYNITPWRETCFSPLHTTGLFVYPLKISENLWFSVVFRNYRK